jgi:drug/metabolite transporter (DMT)-like permease
MRPERSGVLLVLSAALVWSFAGVVARSLSVTDPWTGFMLLREGSRETLRLFRIMGRAGVVVALCFAIASISFVVALGHTTVANILLIQAGIPLIAALMAWAALGERISAGTWAAIAAVMAGIAIMVSDSIGGRVSPIGDGLALLMTVSFAVTIIITRRHAEIAMMPAVCAGTFAAGVVSAFMSLGAQHAGLGVSAIDGVLLFAFGALNLGLGVALFVTGARRIPAALAALVGTAEPMLGPVWVWLVHGEVPATRTLIGGSVVFAALLSHLAWQFMQQRAQQRAEQPLQQGDSVAAAETR